MDMIFITEPKRDEGFIGGIRRENSIAIYRMTMGAWKNVITLLRGDPNFEKLTPVLDLMGEGPIRGAQAFYFTPEEYRSIMEGGHDPT